MPITTPFMSLTLPDVGAGGTVGTTWASYLNTALQAIDSHDHTSGSGNQIPSAGIAIDADLDFFDNGADNLDFVAFTARAVKPTPVLSLYAKGSDLYFEDGAGNEVRITQDAALAGSSDGGFGGDYGDGDELATYSNATKTYSFLQDTAPSTPAKLYSADISIGQATASPNVVTIKSPNSLAASYTLTLPAALPASTKKLQFSNTGVGSFYDDPVATFVVYDGPTTSETVGTSWAALTISSTKFTSSGALVSRSGNNITFSATGTYVFTVDVHNFRTLGGADMMFRIRNTTDSSTDDKTGAVTLLDSPSDPTYRGMSFKLLVTVSNTSKTYQLQAVASNSVGIVNNTSAVDSENVGPVYRITIQST